MKLLKFPYPVILTGLLSLCLINSSNAANLNIRRYTGSTDLINNAASSITDSTNFGSSSQLSRIRRFEFKPTGSGSLSIQSVTLSGTNAAEFSVLGFPSTVSNSWNVFYIRFVPVSGGNKTAQLTIRSNASNHPVFVINLSAYADVCLPGNPVETAAGLHVSSQTTTSDNWTCYCNSAGNLLMALNTSGTGAVVPTNGVELNISSRGAEYFNHGTGFVGNVVGFTGVTKTWAINATTQPVAPVKTRIFFTAADTTALSDTMLKYTGVRLNRLSNIMIYNVINNGKPRHATIATLRQNDIVVFDHGPGSASWSGTNVSLGLFQAELELGNLHTIGLGSSPGGITPLPVNFISQSAKHVAEGVRIAWQVLAEEGDVRFIIERAEEGNRFIPVGTIYSNPSFVQGQVASYTFVDQTPLKTAAWTSYRITAVTVNGEKRMTPVMLVKSGATNPSIHIYQPEKSNEWLVKLPAEATAGTIEMLDMKGNRVHFKAYHAAEEQQQVRLNPGNLTNGIYIIRIADMAAGIYTRRIVQR